MISVHRENSNFFYWIDEDSSSRDMTALGVRRVEWVDFTPNLFRVESCKAPKDSIWIARRICWKVDVKI